MTLYEHILKLNQFAILERSARLSNTWEYYIISWEYYINMCKLYTCLRNITLLHETKETLTSSCFNVRDMGADVRLRQVNRNTEPSSGHVVPGLKLSHDTFIVSLRSAYNFLSRNSALFIPGRFEGWRCTLFFYWLIKRSREYFQ